MSLRTRLACICLAGLGMLLPLQAQTTASSSATTVEVPRLIRISGTLTPPSALVGDRSVVGVTFALYAEQTGGAPLWQETQNVEVDSSGHYTVLLGSTKAEGLPAELFTSVQAQWLGVQREGESEQARIMLASVPFALKAVDAETLGGMPPSAFVAAPPAATTAKSNATASSTTTAGANGTASPNAAATPNASTPPAKPVTGEGTTNYVPLWSSPTTLTSSNIFQSGVTDPKIGMGGIPGQTLLRARLNVVEGYPGSAILGAGSVESQAGGPVSLQLNGLTSIGVQGDVPASGAAVVGTSDNGWGVVGLIGSPVPDDNYLPPFDVFNSAVFGKVSGAKAGIGVSGFVTKGNGVAGANVDPSQPAGFFENTATTGTGGGVTGITNGPNGFGVSGTALAMTGAAYGVTGTTNTPGGAGVYGSSTAILGTAAGVTGVTVSPNGFGVTGIVNATGGGTGVFGQNNALNGYGSGVEGTSASSAGYGVEGINSDTLGGSTGGIGVIGTSSSSNGYGVYGQATSTNTAYTSYGVYGESNTGPGVYGSSTGNNGVVGTTTSPNGSGVYGVATSSSTTGAAYGVYGQSSSNDAVHGMCTAVNCSGVTGVVNSNGSGNTEGISGVNNSTSGASNGVYGHTASPDGVAGLFENIAGGWVLLGRKNVSTNLFWVDGGGNGTFAGALQVNGTSNFGGAVQVNGNLTVTGNLIKASGSFKIDDPIDPANKYLSHSFVESPDMMNIYNGIVRLDARGEAWVVLPDYFEALNRDFRYQLTSVGLPQPRLYIATEVKGNRFKIAGGRANGKVSWQVTGIRHDAWADAHRIPSEEDKPADVRGTYMHPELFGGDADKTAQALEPQVSEKGRN